MPDVDSILREIDKTLALPPKLDPSREDFYAAGLAMVERWGKLDAVAAEFGAGAMDCLVAFLTAEPHFCYKYQPILKQLAGKPPGTPNDYDGNDVVLFWRGWLTANTKPEYAQIAWRQICPRTLRANRAYAAPPVEEELWDLAGDPDPVVRYALARNPNLPEAIWSLLALSPEEDIRFELLLRRAQEPLVLELFSQDGSSMIRKWVAARPDTPATALARLAHDAEHDVREALLRRESIPEPILNYLAQCGDTAVQEVAAKKLREAIPSGPAAPAAPGPVLDKNALAGLAGREQYLAYLSEYKLSEDAVLGIVPELDAERRLKVNQVLITALESGHEDLVKSVERASASNTNVLLAEINRRLVVRFSGHGIAVPEDVYAGVYPTPFYNAFVDRRGSHPLILVKTGAFELLEGAVVPFSLLEPGSARQQARVVAGFVRQYCEQRTLPRAEQFAHLQGDGDRRRFMVHLVTAAEEFVLSHEYGHLASGHLGNALAELPGPGGRAIKVPNRNWDEEYEADRWAIHALVSSASDPVSDEERLAICSGPLLFLSLAGLVEGYQSKLGLRFDTHPPATVRYREIRQALAKAGLNRHVRVGAAFHDFCAFVAEELEIPWDREEAITLVINEMGRLVDDGLEEAVAIPDQRPPRGAEGGESQPQHWWQIWK